MPPFLFPKVERNFPHQSLLSLFFLPHCPFDGVDQGLVIDGLPEKGHETPGAPASSRADASSWAERAMLFGLSLRSDSSSRSSRPVMPSIRISRYPAHRFLVPPGILRQFRRHRHCTRRTAEAAGRPFSLTRRHRSRRPGSPFSPHKLSLGVIANHDALSG
jgi:hypothetical protein